MVLFAVRGTAHGRTVRTAAFYGVEARVALRVLPRFTAVRAPQELTAVLAVQQVLPICLTYCNNTTYKLIQYILCSIVCMYKLT